MGRWGAAITAVVGFVLLGTPAQAAPLGTFTQTSSTYACIDQLGADGCLVYGALDGTGDMASNGSDVLIPAAGSDTLFRAGIFPNGDISSSSFADGCNEPDVGAPPTMGCRLASNLDGVNDVVLVPRDVELYAYSAGTNGLAAFKKDRNGLGGFAQLPGTAGCVSGTGSSQPGSVPGKCQNGRQVRSAVGIAASYGGDDLYLATGSGASAGVALLEVAIDGTLTQPTSTRGCITAGGQATDDDEAAPVLRGCAGPLRGIGSGTARDVAVGIWNDTVYFLTTSGVVVLRRAADGTLEQLPGTGGCIVWDAALAATDGCATGRALTGATQLVPVRDDHVYVATASGAVAALTIADDGPLSQATGPAGCASESGTVTDGAGPCTIARSLTAGGDIAASPDARTVVVRTDPALGEAALLDRDPSSGALTQPSGPSGCVSSTGASSGAAGTCTTGRGIAGGGGVLFHWDPNRVLLGGNDSVGAFLRETAPSCEDESRDTARETPVRIYVFCRDEDGDAVTRTVTTPPRCGTTSVDGEWVTYTPRAGFAGTDGFAVTPSDGEHAGRPGEITVDIRPAGSGATACPAAPVAPGPAAEPRGGGDGTPAPPTTPPAGPGPLAAPPVPPAAPLATPVGGRTLKPDRRGRRGLTLRCPPAATTPCAGRLELRTRGKHRVRRGAARRLVVLRREFSIRPGRRLTVRFALSADVRRALGRTRTRRLALDATTTAVALGIRTGRTTARVTLR